MSELDDSFDLNRTNLINLGSFFTRQQTASLLLEAAEAAAAAAAASASSSSSSSLSLSSSSSSSSSSSPSLSSQQIGTFFYNRTDAEEILNKLSPLRQTVLKAIPKLHFIGIITNVLCSIVLLQKKLLHRKGIFYLVFLAFSDFMYNFLSLLPDFLKDIKLVNYDIFKISNLSCFFYDFRVTSFHFYSVLLTLFVTIDRFNHIHSPLKLDRSFRNTKSKLIVGISMLFGSFIIALPHGFLMVYSEAEKDCDARQFFKMKFANTGFTNYQIYFTFTEPFVIWFIPGLLILIMNSYVIYKIFQSNQLGSNKFGSKYLSVAAYAAAGTYGNNNNNNNNNSANTNLQGSVVNNRKLSQQNCLKFDENYLLNEKLDRKKSSIGFEQIEDCKKSNKTNKPNIFFNNNNNNNSRNRHHRHSSSLKNSSSGTNRNIDASLYKDSITRFNGREYSTTKSKKYENFIKKSGYYRKKKLDASNRSNSSTNKPIGLMQNFCCTSSAATASAAAAATTFTAAGSSPLSSSNRKIFHPNTTNANNTSSSSSSSIIRRFNFRKPSTQSIYSTKNSFIMKQFHSTLSFSSLNSEKNCRTNRADSIVVTCNNNNNKLIDELTKTRSKSADANNHQSFINKSIIAQTNPNNNTTTTTTTTTSTTTVMPGKYLKISVNQISHYVTIITLGFYFILTTIPHGILLSYQNNLTLKLDYNLKEKDDYLNDPLWIKFGTYRDIVSLSKLFFVSNHCINFFFYFLFNRMFRMTFNDLLLKLKNLIKYLAFKLKIASCLSKVNRGCNKAAKSKNSDLVLN